MREKKIAESLEKVSMFLNIGSKSGKKKKNFFFLKIT
jgi:hypothetical protein